MCNINAHIQSTQAQIISFFMIFTSTGKLSITWKKSFLVKKFEWSLYFFARNVSGKGSVPQSIWLLRMVRNYCILFMYLFVHFQGFSSTKPLVIITGMKKMRIHPVHVANSQYTWFTVFAINPLNAIIIDEPHYMQSK